MTHHYIYKEHENDIENRYIYCRMFLNDVYHFYKSVRFKNSKKSYVSNVYRVFNSHHHYVIKRDRCKEVKQQLILDVFFK